MVAFLLIGLGIAIVASMNGRRSIRPQLDLASDLERMRASAQAADAEWAESERRMAESERRMAETAERMRQTREALDREIEASRRRGEQLDELARETR